MNERDLQAQIAGNPRAQAALQAARQQIASMPSTGMLDNIKKAAVIKRAIIDAGVPIPDNYHVDPSGTVHKATPVMGPTQWAILAGVGTLGAASLLAGPSAVTAATTGGSTVASGAPLASVVSPHWWSSAWLPSAISAGAGLVASHQASNANKDAAQLEYEATQQALADAREQRAYEQKRDEEQQQYDRGRYSEERDYTRGVYGEERDYGRGQYANYLGRLDPYRQSGTRALTRVEDVLNRSTPMNPAAARPTNTGGPMVQLKAPTGQIKAIPADQVDQYLARGAVRV